MDAPLTERGKRDLAKRLRCGVNEVRLGKCPTCQNLFYFAAHHPHTFCSRACLRKFSRLRQSRKTAVLARAGFLPGPPPQTLPDLGPEPPAPPKSRDALDRALMRAVVENETAIRENGGKIANKLLWEAVQRIVGGEINETRYGRACARLNLPATRVRGNQGKRIDDETLNRFKTALGIATAPPPSAPAFPTPKPAPRPKSPAAKPAPRSPAPVCPLPPASLPIAAPVCPLPPASLPIAAPAPSASSLSKPRARPAKPAAPIPSPEKPNRPPDALERAIMLVVLENETAIRENGGKIANDLLREAVQRIIGGEISAYHYGRACSRLRIPGILIRGGRKGKRIDDETLNRFKTAYGPREPAPAAKLPPVPAKPDAPPKTPVRPDKTRPQTPPPDEGPSPSDPPWLTRDDSFWECGKIGLRALRKPCLAPSYACFYHRCPNAKDATETPPYPPGFD